MQKIILFDPLTADDVKSRIETISRENNYLNAIILTTARMNGAPPTAGVGLNADGTGVVINFPDVAEEAVETEPSASDIPQPPKAPKVRNT